MGIDEDVSTVLRFLAECDRRHTPRNEEIANATDMEPDRLNDAMSILGQRGHARIARTLGSHPWDFGDAQITPRGRQEFERALVRNQVPQPAVDGDADTGRAEPNGAKVFLVHGHNEAVREAAARFVERLGLEVVVLHEQANQGRTIIEKFVDYSDVAFAVVLLSGDDKGGPQTEPVAAQRPRARQNVIFELGFFLGRLGRERVCALYQKGVEIPSDYQGVLFIELDEAGGWGLQLAREMKAAGLPFDLNNAV